VVQARANLGVPSTLAVDESINTALSGHVGQADPHTQYLQESNNLSDLANVSSARTNLGLGTAAVQPDTRYAHRANNLSDLASVATARTNLGLGTAATAGTTDSRTSASTTLVLQAKGMNDHRTSSDHDGRYYTQSQIDSRVLLDGTAVKTPPGGKVFVQIYKSATQQITATNTKITFTTLSTGRSDYTTPWYYPSPWWDTSNHRFVAPVSGIYNVFAVVYRDPGAGQTSAADFRFGVNGTILTTTGPQGFAPGAGDLGGVSTYTNARIEMTMFLSAGDYVELFNVSAGVSIFGNSTGRTTSFGAFLL